MKHTVKERFLKYVKIDTQADPLSTTLPSSAKQLDLTAVLIQELKEMNVSYETNEAGYVYAFIPANTDKACKKVFFCSHIDTAPDCSGTNVKPIVHSNYQWQDIILPDDPTQIISTRYHKALTTKLGEDIITASGTTLLGADDKAGVAIIMDTLYQLSKGVDFAHGPVRALITTDEEIGKGVAKVDASLLDADFGYTLDGGELGSIEDENFSADSVTLNIIGVSAHPGAAKGKMQNAIKIAGEIIAQLPKDTLSPESTEGREGFIHPTSISGHLESASISFIIRDFNTEALADHITTIEDITKNVIEKYPRSTYELIRKKQYRNMHDIVKHQPFIVNIAKEAITNLNITPLHTQIRGGTDGAGLTQLGLPCPNLFAGQHAIHGKQEWVSVQDMEKGVKMCLEIARLVLEQNP